MRRRASAFRVADAWLNRDTDFTPPFIANREINTWKALGRNDEYIVDQLMRKFRVRKPRAQRMLSDYYSR